MTAHDPDMARGGFFRWLGFGKGERRVLEGQMSADPGEMPDTAVQKRLDVLSEISLFLIEHDLPVSPFTLEAAHDIVTQADSALCARVNQRLAEGHVLTVGFLQGAVDTEAADSAAAQIHALIVRLEQTVDAFAATTSRAHHATSDYNSALEVHVDDLSLIDPETDVIGQITSLAHCMLDRTREVARELNRSERETRTLQKQLANARAEAEVDHLTGLPNRRAFETRYGTEFEATRESGEPLCVAFCDIDEFKRINDQHGHEAGDRVLRTVAQSLATISDVNCHVARHGGEEFVVLLRNKMIEDAYAVIDEAREMIAARRLVNRATDVPFGQITMSAGVAEVHAYANPRDALHAADDALLKAKEAGRNIVLKADKPGT